AAGDCIRGAGARRIGWLLAGCAAVGRFGMLLTIKHTTVYRYGRPVTLLPHRLMLIPRSSHTLDLRSTRVTTSPLAQIEWSQDVFGNVIATATFSEAASELIVSGDIVV